MGKLLEGLKVSILLIDMFLLGCESRTPREPVLKADLELQVINAALTSILPERPPCSPIPSENESSEEYERRRLAFYDEIDSVGKKIEIVNRLEKLDSRYIQFVVEPDTSAAMKLLLKSPREDRKLDLQSLTKVNDIEIVLVDGDEGKVSGLTDCYTLGRVVFFRVGLGEDSTMAAVRYFVRDGSNKGSNGGVLELIRVGEAWKISR